LLRERLESHRSSTDEQAATSERASARAQMLREAHINSVKERAARDSQRAIEAAARKRRRETINAAVLEARMLSVTPALAAAADDPVIQEPLLASRMKRDAEKARRDALAAGIPNRSKARMETELSPHGMSRKVLMQTEEAMPSMEPLTGGGVCSTPRPAEGQSRFPPFEMAAMAANPGLATNPPASIAAAGDAEALEVNVAPLALQPTVNKQPQHTTPRSAQSPRRQPEMPTIVEEDDEVLFYSPERPTRNICRSFERCHTKIPGPSGGRLMACYEIRWPDGSTRKIYGV